METCGGGGMKELKDKYMKINCGVEKKMMNDGKTDE